MTKRIDTNKGEQAFDKLVKDLGYIRAEEVGIKSEQIDNEVREKIINCSFHLENYQVEELISLIQPLIEQAKQEVVSELHNEIEMVKKLGGEEYICIPRVKYQEFMSHYLDNKGEEG